VEASFYALVALRFYYRRKVIREMQSRVEIVYNETGYNEQPDITITSKFGAEVWSRV